MLPERPSAPVTAPSRLDTKLARSQLRPGGAAYTCSRARSSSSVPGAWEPLSPRRMRMAAVCLITLHHVPGSLTERSPKLDRDRLVRELVPPPRFDRERFST